MDDSSVTAFEPEGMHSSRFDTRVPQRTPPVDLAVECTPDLVEGWGR